mmetsp:Transcript_82460/g.215216  ORF Transcript_82460/g.215216 Transcript_82460/m.215216 type:complete len:121 (-) Transcript_82460:158-520(-)
MAPGCALGDAILEAHGEGLCSSGSSQYRRKFSTEGWVRSDLIPGVGCVVARDWQRFVLKCTREFTLVGVPSVLVSAPASSAELARFISSTWPACILSVLERKLLRSFIRSPGAFHSIAGW